MTVYYMHTIDDKPASFDGDQVCFLGLRDRGVLCKSLQQIRTQQMATKRYRSAAGFSTDKFTLGYVREETP
jgi:hypothetical protein